MKARMFASLSQTVKVQKVSPFVFRTSEPRQPFEDSTCLFERAVRKANGMRNRMDLRRRRVTETNGIGGNGQSR